MRVATHEHVLHSRDLSKALARGVRPAVGFTLPDDIVKDPHLTLEEKRAILACWASDACAVRDEPKMRWLLGTPEPVPFVEVKDAMIRLDLRSR